MAGKAYLLDKQCSQCEAKGDGNLLICAGCKVVKYCSKDHQTAHWPTHKEHCVAAKKSRTRMDKEERKLREHPGDFMMPANPFNQPGRFWGWLDTRDYMRARYGVLDNLRKMKTRDAVQLALDHAMGIHELNRSDNMGVRSLTPLLMIRLGKDQEAYDFMKWYATTGNDSHYDWGDMDLPYLDLRGENVFESLDAGDWTDRFGELSHKAAITLIKLRLLLDLRSLKNSVVIGSKVPQEILDSIRTALASNAVASNESVMHDVMNGNDLQPHIDNIQQQLEVMFRSVKDANPYFWPAIVHPGADLTARPPHYSSGSREEMQLILQYNYEAWEETPGAVPWVKEKLS